MSIKAVVMIEVTVGKVREVAAVLRELDEVVSADVVTGPYDVIAIAELPSRAKFRRLVEEIHEAPGVTRTETCLSI